MNFPRRAGRDFGLATPSLRHALRAKPRKQRNPAETPLIVRGNLFRQPEPALCARSLIERARHADRAGRPLERGTGSRCHELRPAVYSLKHARTLERVLPDKQIGISLADILLESSKKPKRKCSASEFSFKGSYDQLLLDR
jgi:hypothetical protein